MRKIQLIGVSVLMAFAGCKAKPHIDNPSPPPIVTPTVITNAVQDTDYPVLPPYIPWWVKES